MSHCDGRKPKRAGRVVEHFDERMLAQQYLDLYAEILSERSNRVLILLGARAPEL